MRNTQEHLFSKVHGVKDNATSTALINSASVALDRASKVAIVDESDSEIAELPAKFRAVVIEATNSAAYSTLDTARINVWETHRAHKLALQDAFTSIKPENAGSLSVAQLNELQRETLEMRKILEARKALPISK